MSRRLFVLVVKHVDVPIMVSFCIWLGYQDITIAQGQVSEAIAGAALGGYLLGRVTEIFRELFDWLEARAW